MEKQQQWFTVLKLYTIALEGLTCPFCYKHPYLPSGPLLQTLYQQRQMELTRGREAWTTFR